MILCVSMQGLKTVLPKQAHRIISPDLKASFPRCLMVVALRTLDIGFIIECDATMLCRVEWRRLSPAGVVAEKRGMEQVASRSHLYMQAYKATPVSWSERTKRLEL